MEKEKEIVNEIHSILKNKGFEYKDNVVVGNTSPDIFFVSPTGFTYVVEVKSWSATAENINRAGDLANLYQSNAGTVGAFVVLPGQFDSRMESGVASIKNFPHFVDSIQTKILPGKKIKKVIIQEKPKKYLFVALPFRRKYDAIYFAIEGAALANGFNAIRVDDDVFIGDILERIIYLIKGSKGMIADISDSNPNVFFEIGYASALHRKIIHIGLLPFKKLPFDVQGKKIIGYKRQDISLLKKTLRKTIKQSVMGK